MLRRVILKGFKTIKAMDLELRPLNVLIGANGAGKSNLVSFFKMLNEMMAGQLQQYIGTTGYARSLLHFGTLMTREMEAQLEFDLDIGVGAFDMQLLHAPVDTLVFAHEMLKFAPINPPVISRWTTVTVRGGYPESKLDTLYNPDHPTTDIDQTGMLIRTFLTDCGVYHFHETSSTARVRQHSYIGDNRLLHSDGGNLAAFLLRLCEENGGAVYERIVATIRLIAPFFDDFDLKPAGPNKEDIVLEWRHKGSDQVFGPHQLSDGTLRAMCLITLLMQPEDELPDLIIVDEPELGLHPYALNMVAALFKKAAHHTQVFISTQSNSFLDNFDPEDVVVVNREGKESQFERPDPEKLKAWLDEYTLGEVWEKNVIGGGPH